MNHKQIYKLIDDVLWKMGMHSDDAVELVFLTGLVESGYKYISQIGSGIARSFWQVEPKTAIDNLQHYLKHRPSLMQKCAEATLVDIKHWQNYDEHLWEEILEKTIAAGIIHARIKYWRVPKKMPTSVEGQANYWKKYYNSELGAGSVEHYIELVDKYLNKKG